MKSLQDDEVCVYDTLTCFIPASTFLLLPIYRKPLHLHTDRSLSISIQPTARPSMTKQFRLLDFTN